jgi:hypothetical protein
MDDNWRPGGTIVWIWIWTGLGNRARLWLGLSHQCDWGPPVAMDSSQVTDLLSWAHTCLWEREDPLLSYYGFQLFSNRLLRVALGGGLSTILRPGLRCWGLESKFGQGFRPLNRGGIDWSRLCLGYKRDVCFEVPSWDTLVRQSLFLWDGTDLAMV